jgi:hypothetical protein
MINSSDANALSKEVKRLTKENAKLRKELWNQWEYNHYEHCGRGDISGSKPHEGDCYWPVPKVLMTKKRVHPSAVS